MILRVPNLPPASEARDLQFDGPVTRPGMAEWEHWMRDFITLLKDASLRGFALVVRRQQHGEGR